MTDSIRELLDRYDEEHAFLRQFVIPEEDRPAFTSAKWSGEYRWFKSPNIVCLEKARLVRDQRVQRSLRRAGSP
jgi:hypothetical protein